MPMYWYGMRMRGYSPACQPRGAVEIRSNDKSVYYNLIAYNHPLTQKEIEDYELDEITPEEVEQWVSKH